VAEVRREIERAYLKVTSGRKGVDARLSEVRAHLSYLSRESVDAGLGAILMGDENARLMRMDNNRGITAAETPKLHSILRASCFTCCCDEHRISIGRGPSKVFGSRLT
jgi:hypothetical protein